jgi:hypothetical protein
VSKWFVGELATWALCSITPLAGCDTARSGKINSRADDAGIACSRAKCSEST